MKKEFHIWDFPKNEITIKLNEYFLNELKVSMIKKFGNISKCGKIIGVSNSMIHQAFNNNSIPLYLIEKIMNSMEFSKSSIERQIIGYKAYSGRTWITNPKLPIIESEDVYELAGHIIGDGHISLEKTKSSGYTNTSKKLIREVELLIQNLFGDVSLTVNIDKRFNAFKLILPRPIPLFLAYQFPKIVKKEIPNILQRSHIVAFLRAFADDESCVCTSEINFVQKNKSSLDNIRELFSILEFKEEWITQVKKKGDLHTLSVKGEGLILFESLIGFKHPEKRRQLKIEIKRKTSKRNIKTMDQTKREITTLLDSPKTAKELSNTIGCEIYIIRKHLKRLQKMGYVSISGYSKYNVPIWRKIQDYIIINDQRKEKIMEMLNSSTLSTREISMKLLLSKDTVMRYLNELKESGNITYAENGRTYFWSKNEHQ